MQESDLVRPKVGRFCRTEIAFLGTSPGIVKELVFRLIENLSDNWNLGYIDCDHQSSEMEKELGIDSSKALSHKARVEIIDKITFSRADFRKAFSVPERHVLLNDIDAAFINGNHFKASKQILIIDKDKTPTLHRKINRLSNVLCVVLAEGASKEDIPPILYERIHNIEHKPIFEIGNTVGISQFIEIVLRQDTGNLNGLLLAGGRSKRMGGKDKAKINYHGKEQRFHMKEILSKYTSKAFMSCRPQQLKDFSDQENLLPDSFINLGPFGALLSAFRQNPNCAWMTVAIDLPFVDDKTIMHLIEQRDPSKLATLYKSKDTGAPQPLLGIWEPRSYLRLLQSLAFGKNSLREILEDANIKLIEPLSDHTLSEVDTMDELDIAIKQLSQQNSI
ncbi:NTP transferase domain-containing protein [Flammeovirga yaeyamensis]|uniref:NTP transferase domain-containing protein n=1 Tax=Flammeovirga yaeyamensis TaxID=367791 RepID=A0AAX1MXQ5_9BACT|nr:MULTISPECIES: NTP transferase domain-containing protein [Flammeovirga]ANQ48516.2 NTP transferase domain-containing protein [Flammeovirga sp. MY04]MBB3696409.1 molybdopterin-guanine dinucleotide biosynthesis protein A [Flammeovirga yaeyamensis]NMF35088.1 NTP transferase domain-containing protein [Flammeovirga yaeyamensis]QWG00091.1 NTP transferase domain-containing protein [Flammeovirga yaeyamensis]